MEKIGAGAWAYLHGGNPAGKFLQGQARLKEGRQDGAKNEMAN
jgi:hypothetical protein